MEQLVNKIRADYPALTFAVDVRASWSPRSHTVKYRASNDQADIWGLLHELGHALLGHTSFDSDLSLLEKEVAAWEKAKVLAGRYSLPIDPDYVQDCLDTYRDWLHKRSQCPTCRLQGAQDAQNRYLCVNCKSMWLVSNARFCRSYRRSQNK